MGSGSSKPKTPRAEPRPDKVSKVQSRDIKAVTKKPDQKPDNSLKPQKVVETEKAKNDKNLQKSSDRNTEIKSNNNGNINKLPTNEKLQSFESDSEEEDIDAVLAATRAEHNHRQQQTLNKPTEYYPESYAQRLQREQYERGQQGLMRQKTIYRNPDEWDVDEVNMTTPLT